VKLVAPLVAALAAALLFLPFLPVIPTGWDPIQFALALGHFDMSLHQPHPPGYPGHLALGWAFNVLGATPGRAVMLASLAGGALAVGAVLALGTRLKDRRVGVMAAILLATNPLLIWYSLSGESYSAEAAVAPLLVLAGLGLRPGTSLPRLAGFFLFFGAAAGIRQSTAVFFLPFAVWRLVVACRSTGTTPAIGRMILAGVAGVAGLAAWAVPLAMLSGGPGRLLHAFGSQFFELFGQAYSPLLGAPTAAVMRNLDGLWRFLLAGASIGGVAALALWPLVRRRTGADETRSVSLGPGPVVTSPREFRIVALLWALPPLLWYVLMYVYKPGYVLILLPMAVIASAAVLAGLDRVRQGLAPLVVGVLALAQFGLFLAPPDAWSRHVSLQSLPGIQYDQTLASSTVDAVRTLANGDPDRVLLVTRDGRFTFRNAMFQAPEFRVIWLLDGDSTGTPMQGVEVCQARDLAVSCRSGSGFWGWVDLPRHADITVPDDVRFLVWIQAENGAFDQALRRSGLPVRDLEAPPVATLTFTPVGPGPLDVRIGPWRFVRLENQPANPDPDAPGS
jgi:hypothetical protein